jgi:hypothetical protein
MIKASQKSTYIVACLFALIACFATSLLIVGALPSMIPIFGVFSILLIMPLGLVLTNICVFWITLNIFPSLNYRKALPWIALYGFIEFMVLSRQFGVEANWILLSLGMLCALAQPIGVAYILKKRSV